MIVLKEHQQKALDFISDKKHCALFITMGSGKTMIGLSAFKKLSEDKYVKKLLVVAPLNVAKITWFSELNKINFDFKMVRCFGTEKQRKSVLEEKHDILVINRENLTWLIENKYHKEYDMLIIDESTSFKNTSSIRFKSLKRILNQFKSRIIMTGTPIGNKLEDIWAQIFLVDQGERLGKSKTSFIDKHFNYNPYNYTCTPLDNSDKVIKTLISDIVFDYVETNKSFKVVYDFKEINATKTVMKMYKELEEELFFQLSEDVCIMTSTTTAMLTKCLQLCSGFVYYEDREKSESEVAVLRRSILVHSLKYDALKEIVSPTPAGDNFIIFYNFIFEREELKRRFPKAVDFREDPEVISREWNEGKIKMLLLHPKSAGHGLNLQQGGDKVIWFSPTYSYEEYTQANARVARYGQKSTKVTITNLIIKNTLEGKIFKLLEKKHETNSSFFKNLGKELFNNKE